MINIAYTPSFCIQVDDRRHLLRITLAGFFGLDDVDRFNISRSEALVRLRCAPNTHLTLCDVSACKLQSQDVVLAFQRVIDDPRCAARRLAIVIGSSLARMQVRRMLHRAGSACFASVPEAEAWLLHDDAQDVRRTG